MDTGSFDEEYELWLEEKRNKCMEMYEATGDQASWGMAQAYDLALKAFKDGDFGDEDEDEDEE